MVQEILAGTVTEEDVAKAQVMDFAARKKMIEQLLGNLEDKFNEALLQEGALEDVKNALKQARPVLAAGLSIDQSFGFITKMIQDSLDELEEAGAADSDEFEKQELVLETLNRFTEACNESGNTQGEQALEAVNYEYRGELGKLEILKNETELAIGNCIGFLRMAYEDGPETDAFVKGIEKNNTGARYLSKFGSQSFFLYKHVMAPGEVYDKSAADETEGD